MNKKIDFEKTALNQNTATLVEVYDNMAAIVGAIIVASHRADWTEEEKNQFIAERVKLHVKFLTEK